MCTFHLNAIARRGVATLAFSFAWSLAGAQAPANDLPVNATTILVDQPCNNPYTNLNATVVPGEPGAFCVGANENYATVWFKFTAPVSGAVKVTTDFTGYQLDDTRIALFDVENVADYGTYQSLACDEDNGVLGAGYGSILYITDLTAGTDYYIVVDQYDDDPSTTPGSFCLEVSTLTDAMLPAAATCTQGQGSGGSGGYRGWASLVDSDGKLIANVRPNSAASSLYAYAISPWLSIHQGAPRQDANGLAYLDRNSFYSGFFVDDNGDDLPYADMDLQLFFTGTELSALGTPLNNLNVTHSPAAACSGDASGDGSQTALIASGSGSSGNVSWINITTPDFSNFYLMNGTTPLPIDLRSITAANAGSSIRVDWSTANEDPGEYFELERSADSRAFAFLAKINGEGRASAYTCFDRAPLPGTGYYRLKMISNDGKTRYSKVVQATMTGNAAFSFQAAPNPTAGNLIVSIRGNLGEHALIAITDISGKVVMQTPVTATTATVSMAGLAKGVYLLKYTDSKQSQTLKVTRQ